MVTNNLNLELCVCCVCNTYIPVIISNIWQVGGNPAKTTVTGLIPNRYRIDIRSRVPHDSVHLADKESLSSIGSRDLNEHGKECGGGCCSRLRSNRHCHSRASRHRAMVAFTAPVLCPVVVSAEAIIALRQGEDCLPIYIGHFVVTGVRAAVEGVNVHPRLVRAITVPDYDC